MEDVRTVNIFGKDIPVRKWGCLNCSNKEPLYIEVPRVNIFIQTTNVCNANCDFCIYHGKDKKVFNIEKLAKILSEISSDTSIDIGKLNFTGGEPTIGKNVSFDELISACKSNLDLTRKPEITLNTNGFDLEPILKHQDFLDSVGLSRHHFRDDLNFEIFRTTSIPDSEQLKEFMRKVDRKEIIQFRCNLIKGYIDSYDGMSQYLEYVLDLGGFDCGFVTLAPNNDFCRGHQIDFNSLININKDIIKVGSWQRLEDDNFNNIYCNCANYVYSDKKGRMCKFYARLFCNNDNMDGMLVYDGEYLRHGFGGPIIF